MRDYERVEETTTIVKHNFDLPVNWVDVQKLLSHVLRSTEGTALNPGHEPYDDQLWYESDGEVLSLCYKKESS